MESWVWKASSFSPALGKGERGERGARGAVQGMASSLGRRQRGVRGGGGRSREVKPHGGQRRAKLPDTGFSLLCYGGFVCPSVGETILGIRAICSNEVFCAPRVGVWVK